MHAGTSTVVPQAHYADSTWPFEEGRAEVLERAKEYFHLVLAPDKARGRAKAAKHRLLNELDLYESFHLILKQTSWAVIYRDDKSEAPQQIPASCTCKWC